MSGLKQDIGSDYHRYDGILFLWLGIKRWAVSTLKSRASVHFWSLQKIQLQTRELKKTRNMLKETF